VTAAAIDYRADRIVMAADSAVYDDDGVVHGYLSKLNVLLTIRARVLLPRSVAHFIRNRLRMPSPKRNRNAMPRIVWTVATAFNQSGYS
jgi:hypothetical protein